jgi:hypothetical protein
MPSSQTMICFRGVMPAARAIYSEAGLGQNVAARDFCNDNEVIPKSRCNLMEGRCELVRMETRRF